MSDDIAKRDDQTASEPAMVSPQTGRQLVALVDNVESLAAATGLVPPEPYVTKSNFSIIR